MNHVREAGAAASMRLLQCGGIGTSAAHCNNRTPVRPPPTSVLEATLPRAPCVCTASIYSSSRACLASVFRRLGGWAGGWEDGAA